MILKRVFAAIEGSPRCGPILVLAGLLICFGHLGEGIASAQAIGGQTGGAPASGGVTAGVMQGVGEVPAAAPATAVQPNQALLYPDENFKLGPGDLIGVRLFGVPEYSVTVRIGLDGSAELPYIESVHFAGLTVRAAQNLVADKLRGGGFYENPQITIQVLDTVNGSVLITGEVRTTVPVSTERSLRDVLLAAGGLPASASHTIKIVRPGVAEPIVVNLGTDLAASEAANIPVRPHDIIQITRASVVYVIGAFKQQGQVPLDQAMPLTLFQLAALSGGVGWEGRYQDLRLIRTVGNQRKLIEVDIKKVMNGKAPDPILQANDIVFLPTNQMKAVLKNLGIGGVLGLVSLVYSIRDY